VAVDLSDLRAHYDGVFGEHFKISKKLFRKIKPNPKEYDKKTLENARARATRFSKLAGAGEIWEHEPTISEIRGAIKAAMARNPGGAPGRDGISWRLLSLFKFSRPDGTILRPLEQPLKLFIGAIWRLEVAPECWGLDLLCPILKPGKDALECSSYRPVFLQSVIFKILDRIIDRRIRDFLKRCNPLEPEQGGFVSHRGTTEQFFVLQELILGCPESLVAFIDIKSAFDRCQRPFLYTKLWDRGIKTKIFRLIMNVYDCTDAKMRDLYTEELLNVLCGVREGGNSSPLFFNIFFNDLITELKEAGVGTAVAGLIMCCLFYADDIVLIAQTPQKLQILLDICYKYGQRFHMSFGTDKCEVVVGVEADQTFRQHQWTLGRTKLKVVDYYKYLGIEIGGGGVDFKSYFARTEKKFWKRLNTLVRVGT